MIMFQTSQIDNMNQITEHIWLGDYVSTSRKYRLKQCGITHILTVGSGLPPKLPRDFQYCVIPVWDDPKANLKQHWDTCHSFMRHAIDSGGKVLVHCFAGVSRSSSTVISFLMREYGLGMHDAYKFTKEKRWFINPNHGFKK